MSVHPDGYPFPHLNAMNVQLNQLRVTMNIFVNLNTLNLCQKKKPVCHTKSVVLILKPVVRTAISLSLKRHTNDWL